MQLEKSREWFYSAKEAIEFVTDGLGFKPLPKYKGKIPKLKADKPLQFMGRTQAATVSLMPASGMVLVKLTKAI